MRRVLALVVLVVAGCGGGGSPSSKTKETHDSANSGCTDIYDSCPQGQSFQSCCTTAGCTYVFADGTTFRSGTDAVIYCFGGQPSSGGGGTSPPPSSPPPSSPPPSSPPPNSSPAPSCQGVALSCDSRSAQGTCESDSSGCYWQGDVCSGAASSCGYFQSASNCYAQLGCVWDYNYQGCYGGASPCWRFYGPSTCSGQYGCYWTVGGCYGSAPPCYTLNGPSTCASIAGCYWQ